MKLPPIQSLRLRLTLLFLILSAVAWLSASLVAWQQTTDKLNTLFDTQQMLFAKRLSAMTFDELSTSPRTAKAPKKDRRGHLDDDALAFAIYSSEGKMLLHDGDNGQHIPWTYRRDGFENGHLSDDDEEWRFLWLTSPDGRHRIAVGQEWDYRKEMALDIVTNQLTPWLIALPLMLLLLVILLSRELRPLRRLAYALGSRAPDSPEQLNDAGVPNEVRPLVTALNQLFTRTHTMMARERRFTSDAAHELRSPLTALKVQTEVAQLSQDDPDARQKALSQLHVGIDRATRLVDQLLTLSRLDSLEQLEDVEPVALDALLQSAVMDVYHGAQQAGVDVRLQLHAVDITRMGQPLLLGVMVRNVLDNAIRYSPAGSVVTATLERNAIRISDNGPGISDEVLARIGERFYRPPGQSETGSGLGLSIVKRIAQMHHMTVSLRNNTSQGFTVEVAW